MPRLVSISKNDLFSSQEANRFPSRILLLVDSKPCEAEIDVIIGAHHQPEAVNLTIDNYLALEKSSYLHILVIETSTSLNTFKQIREGSNISKVLILNPVIATLPRLGGKLWASNGAALAAQLGCRFGHAPFIFFSHSDMMGYKQDFLSFLKTKINIKTAIASFTQRHLIPFTGGMMYERQRLTLQGIDWLPKPTNAYQIPGLDSFRDRIKHLNWIDTGEQLIFHSLQTGMRAHICASRGSTDDFFGHPLDYYGLTEREIKETEIPIDYAQLNITREDFSRKYPELARNDFVWRKSFDDNGDVIFIHRGRGTSNRRRNDRRGDFISFVRDFNHAL